jgi:superoxide dismutase, Cu-Zn family
MAMKSTHVVLTTGLTLLFVACSREPPAREAIAQLAPTQGSAVTGSLALAPSPAGVRITGTVQGLAPDGEFGFHVHERGDCSAPDASSAGAHFNPDQARHGNPGGAEHHAGDMLNIRADSEGVAQVDTTAAGTDLVGKAIVVHESPDDYTTQPSGTSGKRIACGVIATP